MSRTLETTKMPASESPELPEQTLEAGGPWAAPHGNETILLVDDEMSVRVLTRHVLQRYGYRVLEAADEKQAMKIWADEGASIKLLLLDINISATRSGIDLARRMRKTNPEMRVLFTSGLFPEHTEDTADQLVCSHFLQKPFEPLTLLEMVRAEIDEPQTPEQLFSEIIRAY